MAKYMTSSLDCKIYIMTKKKDLKQVIQHNFYVNGKVSEVV